MERMDFIEVEAKSLDLAILIGMRELGIDNEDRAVVEVVTEPTPGFLGFGATPAVVRISHRADVTHIEPSDEHRRPHSGQSAATDGAPAGASESASEPSPVSSDEMIERAKRDL